MKQFLHGIDYLLWMMVIVAELALFIGAVRRRLASDFPRFVWLLGFILFKSLLLAFINFAGGFWAYFYVFYFGAALESVLMVLVAAEIFRLLFEPVSALRPNALSRMAGAVIAIIAAAITVVTWQPAADAPLVSVVLYKSRTALETVICLSFWLLALYSRFLGLPWRSRMADIVSGFLFQLTLQSVTHALIWLTPKYHSAVSRANSLVYLGGLCFWFAALRKQEPTFAPASQGQLLLLRAHLTRMHSEMDRLDALGIQHALSQALPPRGSRLRPQTFDELVKVLKAVEFPEYEPISYRQMIELRRGILYNCEWLLRFVRDQYRPLVNDLEALGDVETLQEDALRVIAECRKVYFGFSPRARKKRMQSLFGLYDQMRLAAMLLCGGSQPYLIDDIATAL